jgi:hypothetical protein
MTFLEPIIAVVVGAGVTALTVRTSKTKAAAKLAKYGPLIQKAYNIIDPVLDKNMKGWNGSQVDAAFQVVVEALADGTLTPNEIQYVSVKLAEGWLPAAAANKVREYEKINELLPQLKAAQVVADHVNGVTNKAAVYSAVRRFIK